MSRSKIIFVSKRFQADNLLHHSKRKCQPGINVTKSGCSQKHQDFVKLLEQRMACEQPQSLDDEWRALGKTLYGAAVDSNGRKELKTTDWFEANISVLEPVINNKRRILEHYKHNPRHQNPKALRTA